jgi:hypothetical protein
LGVWLEHDPADFGIAPPHLSRSQLPAAIGSAFCWSWAPPRHLGATVRWRTWRTTCRE